MWTIRKHRLEVVQPEERLSEMDVGDFERKLVDQATFKQALQKLDGSAMPADHLR